VVRRADGRRGVPAGSAARRLETGSGGEPTAAFVPAERAALRTAGELDDPAPVVLP